MQGIPSWIGEKQQEMIKYNYAIGEGDLSNSDAFDIESTDNTSGCEQTETEIVTFFKCTQLFYCLYFSISTHITT